VLQRFGLPAALPWLAEWTQDKYKVDVEVIADPRADSARKDVRTLLFESVRELLFNAVKHAQADRITLELAVHGDEQLCITVSDQGLGFDPAALDYRSTASQVGWGLFSIRERLTLLGGSFEIESAPGEGTRVRLVAPCGAKPGPVAGPAVPTAEPIGAARSNGHGHEASGALRIVLVDDHAEVRNAFRELLNRQPQFSVVGEGSNGFEAIAQAHTLRPDVILMDISMPHMDGIEAHPVHASGYSDFRLVDAAPQRCRESDRAGGGGRLLRQRHRHVAPARASDGGPRIPQQHECCWPSGRLVSRVCALSVTAPSVATRR
jgi:CheY-like chemotaxis protein